MDGEQHLGEKRKSLTFRHKHEYARRFRIACRASVISWIGYLRFAYYKTTLCSKAWYRVDGDVSARIVIIYHSIVLLPIDVLRWGWTLQRGWNIEGRFIWLEIEKRNEGRNRFADELLEQDQCRPRPFVIVQWFETVLKCLAPYGIMNQIKQHLDSSCWFNGWRANRMGGSNDTCTFDEPILATWTPKSINGT